MTNPTPIPHGTAFHGAAPHCVQLDARAAVATDGGAISLPRRLSYSEARDRVADVGPRVEAFQARYDTTRSHKAHADLTNAVTALMRAENALRRLESAKTHQRRTTCT